MGFSYKGKYYTYRYVYKGYGYGSPSFPSSASRKAYMVEYNIGQHELYILFDNNYFYDYQWEMV
jgi:hypothetical protein